MSKLTSIKIKQDDFRLPTPEVLQEQNLAIYDILQNNLFELNGFSNYNQMKLNISYKEGSLIFEVFSSYSDIFILLILAK